MDFFKDYLQKHKWLFYLWISLDFIIIFLPQWLSSIWSLAEKMLGREIAMQDITWAYFITVPVGLIMFVIAIRAVRSKKTTAVEITHKSENLTDTLTMMHRRLVELQKEKALHTKVSAKQLEAVLPTLADRMGTVKLKDWPKFKRNLNSRIRRAAPRRPKRLWRTFNFRGFAKWRERVYLSALSVAAEVRDELFISKNWTFEDATKISEWLDGYDWGVKKLRDNDSQWKALYELISHYLEDEALRNLIERHIDFSYIYNNETLIIHYSGRHLNNEFSLMLHETLVGSPISPAKSEIALGEILEQITERLKVLNGRYLPYQGVEVKPITGKREADYERTSHLMWAELQIMNSGSNELKDVQVNITRCLTLQEKQGSENKNDYIMWNQLNLLPFCIYWSERQAQPNQMSIRIPSRATRSALVAFQNNSNGGQFNFNSPNKEWVVGGVKIDLEVSNDETVLWRGSFYIECRPNYVGRTIAEYDPARFEYLEWDIWANNRNIIPFSIGK